MNINTLDWDISILDEFNIPIETLPKILASTDNYGKVLEGYLKNVPVTGVIGDQQSACMGHLLNYGEVKNTYGTGSFLLMNTGDKPVASQHGLLTTVLYKNQDQAPLYALEGAIETAGSALTWLMNNLKLFNDYSMIKFLYDSVEDNGGVVFVPAFSGLFSPHWDSTAKGMLIGLTMHTQQGNIIHATFEAISMRTYEVVKSFEMESQIKVQQIKVDGGLSVSDEFLQIQSDILDIKVERKEEKEVTILGSAICAGLYVDFWKSLEELKNSLKVERLFEPKMNKSKVTDIISKWNKAVERAKNWN